MSEPLVSEIDWLNTEPEVLARQIVKISTSSYRRDIGIGCVDIENLIGNLSRIFKAMKDEIDHSEPYEEAKLTEKAG